MFFSFFVYFVFFFFSIFFVFVFFFLFISFFVFFFLFVFFCFFFVSFFFLYEAAGPKYEAAGRGGRPYVSTRRPVLPQPYFSPTSTLLQPYFGERGRGWH